MRVTGSYDGQTINEAVTFAIPNVYAGSIDQAIGKAERRAYKWLYERLTNCHIPDGDADDAVDVQATVSDAPQPAANTANMLAALAEKDISEDDLTDYCRRTGRVEPDEEWTDASQEFLAYAHERPEALAAKILENGAKA